LIHKFVAPLDVTPAASLKFDAQFRMDSIGPLSIRKTFSMPARIDAKESEVSQAAEQRFFLMMPMRGSVSISQYGRQSVLEEGDFVLFDSTAPGWLEFAEPNISYHVMISPAELRSRLPNPESLCGVRSFKHREYGGVVSSLLDDVWGQIERGFPQEYGLTIAKNLLDVVATAYALQHGAKFSESASMSARRAHIKRFVEARLRDPSLSAASVADYFGISTRYVGMIFEEELEPISAYILRRRLEECAHQLTSAIWSAHSVTDIARTWCFGNRAHFSRVFKKRFGVSPREYRRINRIDPATCEQAPSVLNKEAAAP
jgi:AraC family transcriptional regulator, positive regulator of tynA and feaB